MNPRNETQRKGKRNDVARNLHTHGSIIYSATQPRRAPATISTHLSTTAVRGARPANLVPKALSAAITNHPSASPIVDAQHSRSSTHWATLPTIITVQLLTLCSTADCRETPHRITTSTTAGPSFGKSTTLILDSSTLSAGSPAQFHDALDNMEVDPAASAAPPHDLHDDTLGGIEGSPHLVSDQMSQDPLEPQQSQPFDHGVPYSPSRDSEVDPHARYDTPPMPAQQQPHSISRPPSGLSGAGGDRHHSDHASRGSSSAEQQNGRNHVVIKVGMVGDAQIGKTSLMVKYVEGSWDEDYIQTLGVNFMEKTISIRNTEITFSIWDLGGQREFVNMLPLVCNDAVAILFMFDLTRKSTLNSIKEWYRQGRGFNKTAIPILVGTKYDHFVNFPREDQEEISNQARRFAKAMRAALIFSSTSHSINVQKIQVLFATAQLPAGPVIGHESIPRTFSVKKPPISAG
ncbi:hypothetical protein SCUP234_09064 [Seiridium cupressi]